MTKTFTQICFQALGIFLVGLFFSVNQATACTVGGEVNLSNPTMGDTLCMGSEAQLFLSGYEGEILRWERSTDNGNTWQPLSHRERTYVTEPLFETTLFRAVVKKGTCAEKFSKEKKVVPKDYSNINVVLNARWDNNTHLCDADLVRGFEVNWLTIQGYIGVKNCTIILLIRPEDVQEWDTLHGFFSDNWRNNLTTNGYLSISEALVIPSNGDWSFDSFRYYQRYSVRRYAEYLQPTKDKIKLVCRALIVTSCGTISTNSVHVSFNNTGPTHKFKIDKKEICSDEAFRLWYDRYNYNYYGYERDSGLVRWYGVNLKPDVDDNLNYTYMANTSFKFDKNYDKRFNNNELAGIGLFHSVSYREFWKGDTSRYNPQRAMCTYYNNDTLYFFGKDEGETYLRNYHHEKNFLIWDEKFDDPEYVKDFLDENGKFRLIFFATVEDITRTGDYYNGPLNNGCFDEQNTHIYYSDTMSILVTPRTLGGRIKSSQYYCNQGVPSKLTLTEHRGKVLFWESSVDGMNWTRIPHTDTTYLPVNLTQTTYFRAQVQNGNCSVQPSKFARIAFNPQTKAGILVGKNSRCPLDETPTITLRGQVGQVDHWEISYNGTTWENVPNIATNFKPDTVLRDTWVRAVVISPGCNPETTEAHKITYLSALLFDVPKIKAPAWVCNKDQFINLELPVDASMVVDWEVNDCCANPAFWEKVSQAGGKNTLRYAFVKNCIPGCCYGNTTYWFRVRLRYSMLCNDVYTLVVPVSVYCCPTQIKCRGGSRCTGEGGNSGNKGGNSGNSGVWLDVTNPLVCPNPWLCVGEQVSLFPSPEGLPYFDRWEYAELTHNQENLTWIRVPNSEPDYVSHPLNVSTCFRSVSVINGREFPGERFCVRVLPNTRAGYVTKNRTVCKGENSDTLRVNDWLGEIKIWQSSTDSINWTDIIHSDSIYQSLGLQQTTWFRSVVRLCNAKCALDYSKPVKITVLPFDSTKGGVAVARFDTICVGGKPKIKLQGEMGGVIFWQETTPEDTLFKNARRINVFASELEADPITSAKIYRACVKNSDCETKFSKPVLINVGNPRAFAEFEGNRETCPGSRTTLYIKKRKGDIVRWEYQENGGWTAIANQKDTLLTHQLAHDTRFRVVLKIDGCNEVHSDEITVTTTGQTLGGTVKEDKTACITRNGNNQLVYPSATFELKDYRGNILFWETSENNGQTWTKVPVSTPTFALNNVSRTTLIRATVAFEGCDTLKSINVATFTIKPETQAGTITVKDRFVCANGKTELSLQNYSGQIIRWEYDNNYNFTNPRIINSTDAVIETPAIVANNTYFRAVLRGDCDNVNSPIALVERFNLTTSGNISGSEAVCTGKSIKLKVAYYQGRIERWESSPANENVWTPINETSDQITTSALSADTKFRVVLQIPTCKSVYSQEFKVKVITQPKGGTINPAVKEACIAYQGGSAYQMFSLTDHEGSIKYWQISTDNGTTWVRSNSYGTNYYLNTYKTTWIRAVVQAEGCDSVFSTVAKLTVTPYVKIGNLTTSDNTVCKSNPFPIALDVSGTDNNIIRWEKTNDVNCSSGWTTITHTLSSYLAENVQQPTCFRAVAGSTCATQSSNFVKIEVLEQAEAGKINLSKALVCEDEFVNMNLSNYKGNILGWQISTDGRSWQEIYRTEGSRTLNQKVTRNTRFRVKVGMEGCGTVFSEPVFVEVRPKVNTGQLTGGNSTICRGETVELKLVGHNRKIIRWEMTRDSWDQAVPNYKKVDTWETEALYFTTAFRAVIEGCLPNETAYSPEIRITVNPCFVCQAPVNLRLLENRGTSVKLGWLQNFPNAQNELSYRALGATEWTVLPLTAEQSIEISGLTSCTNYEARIRSIANGTLSEYSSVITFQPVTQPNAPTASQITPTNALIQWNGTATAYQIRYRVRGTTNWTSSSTILNQTSRLLIGLKNRTTYEVQVRAACAENQSFPDWSENTITFTTGQSIALCTERKPSAPLNVTVSSIKSNQATVRWTNIPDSRGTAVIYGLNNVSPSRWTQVLLCAPSDSLILSGLEPNKQYRVRVRTLCEQCTRHGGTDKKSDWANIPDFSTLNGKEESVFETTPPQIQIYPNPNNGSFMVNLPDSQTEDTVLLQIFDLSGRLIWFNEYSFAPILDVHPQDISAGTYIFQVRSGALIHHLRIVVE